MELNRRNGLKTALGGRDEKSLTLLLNYLCKYVNDPRFSYFLMYIVDQTLDLYAASIGNCPATDKLNCVGLDFPSGRPLEVACD